MSASAKTTLIFIGLPYTGKTTLIQRLQDVYPGEALYADEIFTRTVPSSEISLVRWLDEGFRLVAQIQAIVQQSTRKRFFVELGTMRAMPRDELVSWCREQRYNVIPIWCQCTNVEALQLRRQARIDEIGEGGTSGVKIDISLDDLYQRICAAFEQPAVEDGYIVIDTYQTADENLAAIHQILTSAH